MDSLSAVSPSVLAEREVIRQPLVPRPGTYVLKGGGAVRSRGLAFPVTGAREMNVPGQCRVEAISVLLSGAPWPQQLQPVSVSNRPATGWTESNRSSESEHRRMAMAQN